MRPESLDFGARPGLMLSRGVAWVLMLAMVNNRPIRAQHLLPEFPPIRVANLSHSWSRTSRLIHHTTFSTDSVATTSNHWREGAIAGAILGGVGGAWFAAGFCDNGRPCFGRTVAGGFVGAATGLGVGALVGGLFPKRQGRPPDAR